MIFLSVFMTDNMRHFFSAFALLALLVSCNVAAPAPFGATPSQSQVEWQQMEYNMFIHFGPNTFSGVEWGDGKEKADIFNPTEMDCRQWAETAKKAGMKGIIITAKHHDGFCLWPNPVSGHTVAQSSWRDGKGDVLKDLSEACREFGLKFGVYISPWDRNDPHYGTDEYNDIFVKTLEDALGNYGPVFEQWFDGACGEGPNGKVQVYDWPLFNSTVFRMQPEAIIFSNFGPGCRWVGNEKGHAGRTCWSTVDSDGTFTGKTDRAVLNAGKKGGNAWIPAETDVSIRPGWFWKERETPRVKSLQHLLKIYYESVGRNSLLLLNVPADTRGLIDKVDSTRLIEFRAALDEIFSVDLSEGASVEAENVRGGARKFRAENLLNDNYDRYWAVDDSIRAVSFTVTLPEVRTFNRVQLQEYIPLGQRVSGFSVEVLGEDGEWMLVARETTIGYKRIVHIPTVSSKAVRVNIEKSEAAPVLNGFSLFMDNIYVSDEKSNVATGKTNKASEPLMLDLGTEKMVSGFVYAPIEKGEGGCIVTYRLEYSSDGSSWKTIYTDKMFENIINNPIAQEVVLDSPVKARMLRLTPIRAEISSGSVGEPSPTYGVSAFTALLP